MNLQTRVFLLAGFLPTLLVADVKVADIKPEIALFVELNPVGSFAARSGQVQGVVFQSGSLLEADRITLKLDSLSTGIELRDKHMKEKYFETAKFPEAVLTQARGEKGSFKADLKIRNKTKSVAGTYTIEGQSMNAVFTCALSDFEIPEANYMGVGVEDEVRVEVRLPVQKKAAASAVGEGVH